MARPGLRLVEPRLGERDKNVIGLILFINSVTEALVLNSIKSACPGATDENTQLISLLMNGLIFHHLILACQVWARE